MFLFLDLHGSTILSTSMRLVPINPLDNSTSRLLQRSDLMFRTHSALLVINLSKITRFEIIVFLIDLMSHLCL